MIGRWIDSWFAPGNIVNRWDITSLSVTDEVCFFEWFFECTYAGNRSGFEGASLARVSQGKISFLRRFCFQSLHHRLVDWTKPSNTYAGYFAYLF